MFKVIIKNLDGSLLGQFNRAETYAIAHEWLDLQLSKEFYIGKESKRSALLEKVLVITSEAYLEEVLDGEGNVLEVIAHEAITELQDNPLLTHPRATSVYLHEISPEIIVDGEDNIPAETANVFDIEAEYTFEGPIDITAEYEASIIRKNRIATGDAVRTLTNDIMNLVIGFNMEMALTSDQLDTMTVTFEPITSLLEKFRPYHAKALIESIVVDEIVTQEMKDEILKCYTLVN